MRAALRVLQGQFLKEHSMEQELGTLVWVRLLGFESFALAFCKPPYPIYQTETVIVLTTQRSYEIYGKQLVLVSIQ